MSFLLFLGCLVIAIRRRRRRQTLLVPSIVGLLALINMLRVLVGFIRVFEVVAQVDPADKATILAAGISETTHSSALLLAVEVPLIIGAYFVDRWLLRRAVVASQVGTASVPPESLCAVHPAQAASFVCRRCGTFACRACAGEDGVQCRACFQRIASRARMGANLKFFMQWTALSTLGWLLGVVAVVLGQLFFGEAPGFMKDGFVGAISGLTLGLFQWLGLRLRARVTPWWMAPAVAAFALWGAGSSAQSSPDFVAVVLPGVVMSAMQWPLMKARAPRAWLWIPASGAASLIAHYLALSVSSASSAPQMALAVVSYAVVDSALCGIILARWIIPQPLSEAPKSEPTSLVSPTASPS
jgi:hypothetical protein